jgi:hypothetical protein
MAEDESVEDFVVEFEGNLDLDTVLDKKIQLIGIDTDKPVLKIDTKFYNLDIKDSLGTRLLFETKDDKLEFFTKTDKQISAHRVMIKPK